MLQWLRQVEKAKQRSAGTDLRSLADFAREKPPSELNSPEQLAERQKFLDDSLQNRKVSKEFFERILAGNELQDVNYLARGARAARAVARIVIKTPSGQTVGYGTGFLIAPLVLITNHHVLDSAGTALRSQAQFDFEMDIDGNPLSAATYAFLPTQLFFTSESLDFTIVAVAPQPDVGLGSLGQYGYLPLLGVTGKVAEGEWLTIIQHPNGDRKQVCVRENKLLKRDPDVLWYSTDTLGGSSGSPAFNNDWFVVALHHSGVPEEKDGRIQTLSGQDYDPARHTEQDIKWIANEGIRVSRIVDTLAQALPNHPLLQPVFDATPQTARIAAASAGRQANTSLPAIHLPASCFPHPQPNEQGGSSMSNDNARTITVTLEIDPSGDARVVGSSRSSYEATVAFVKSKSNQPLAPFDVPFDATYKDRKGYNEEFLERDGIQVHLPQLQPALKATATKLIEPPDEANPYVLRYHNYSLVMHSERKFAIYSAANVDFAGRFDMSRPPDVWRQDPRIPLDRQISNFYYEKNQFDRGHLTRREDLEFGKTRKDALQSAADTCHWTNCTPQHAHFNQNKQLWQGVERHVLEDAIENNSFKAQVITGPVLQDDDPVWERFKEIQYPVKFWKVVAAINSDGDLFATAYILDQTEVIAQYGIEAAPLVPFSPFKTFQVPIAEVEKQTNLLFHATVGGTKRSLSEFDPLRSGVSKVMRARLRPVGSEAFHAETDTPSNHLLLTSLEDIVC